MPAERKYSDNEAMEMMRDYYDKGMTLNQLGEKWNTNPGSIRRCMERKAVQEKYGEELTKRERRAEFRKRSAALKAMEASPQMMDQIIAIASQDVGSTDIKFQYAIHNAAAAVLDRAGVQAKQEESKEVHVILESGIELGEPE